MKVHTFLVWQLLLYHWLRAGASEHALSEALRCLSLAADNALENPHATFLIWLTVHATFLIWQADNALENFAAAEALRLSCAVLI